jgi:hypothetical protein
MSAHGSICAACEAESSSVTMAPDITEKNYF